MGIIQAALGATLGTLADQWKDYFICESIEREVLVVRGTKLVTGRSSNRFGSDNIITEGSGIVVSDGQCAVIVDQGVVTNLIAKPGLYTFESSAEPSIFCGELNEQRLRLVFETMWERFKYGGAPGRDQRVYYFNLKEIMDNKFGTAVPIPFRVVDKNLGLDVDVSLRCHGVFSFKIVDPISFYTNVCGNVANQYDVQELQGQLKTEFIAALQPALARLSELEIRPYALPSHTQELCEVLNQELAKKWSQLRGISVVSVAINSITLPDEDAKLIKQKQFSAINKDPKMAAAVLTEAQAQAMQTAAANSGGAIQGFMGMGMAAQAGGMNAADLYKLGAQEHGGQTAAGWRCPECGALSQGKFCPQCGKPKPETKETWTCSCGTVNSGKFCSECGKPRPESTVHKCAKCGYTVSAGEKLPKFCPECGAPFAG
ncbi:MAG: SPFH domain-containing protein [Succinivibrio sp.]|nr:SPFH domain-containing protein [Succinivibrio sp.]